MSLNARVETQGGRIVLVVEDDAIVRPILAELLEAAGYRPVTAEHGREALERLRAGLRPDCILLDWLMPVMDGAQFLAAAQAEPGIAALPVVILSGADSEDDARLVESGAPCLSKPIDLRLLVQTLEQVCGPGT